MTSCTEIVSAKLPQSEEKADQQDRPAQGWPQRRRHAKGRTDRFIGRKQPPPQPERQIDRNKTRDGRAQQRATRIAQQIERTDRSPDDHQARDREQHLQQRDHKGKSLAPRAGGPVLLQKVGPAPDEDPAAQHQEKTRGTEQDREKGTVPRAFTQAAVGRDLRSDLITQKPEQIGSAGQGRWPVERIDRRRVALEQRAGLAIGQDGVDFRDQAIGAVEGLIGGDARQLRLRHLFHQGRAPIRNRGGNALTLGRGRAQGVDLGLQGGDAVGIGILRGQKARAPVDQGDPEVFQKRRRSGARRDQILGADRLDIPCGIVDLGRGGRADRGRALRKDGLRRTTKREQAEKQRGEQKTFHQSSKTAGISAAGRSNHAGTGRPFSRRKSGLYSLD